MLETKRVSVIQLVQAAQDRSQLVAKVLADLPEWFGLPDSTQEYIDQASDRVCFQAGEGWGFITLQETSPVCLEIHCMGVLKAHQGQGLGRQLMAAAEDYAISQGYHYLQVKTVAPGHYEAYDATNAFYQACGYEAIEVFPDLWDEWNPCLLRLKYLKTN